VGAGKTITYQSLGADLHGNVPPTTFDVPPFHRGIHAEADRDLFVSANTATGFTIKAGFAGPEPPFEINFSFTTIGAVSAGVDTISANAGIPERMFVWQDEFFLDPIPNDTYTFRMFGYHLPNALSAGTDAPSALGIYGEVIFTKTKVLIARELNVANEGQIQQQYANVAAIADKVDRERHHTVMIVDAKGGGYWT